MRSKEKAVSGVVFQLLMKMQPYRVTHFTWMPPTTLQLNFFLFFLIGGFILTLYLLCGLVGGAKKIITSYPCPQPLRSFMKHKKNPLPIK